MMGTSSYTADSVRVFYPKSPGHVPNRPTGEAAAAAVAAKHMTGVDT